MSAISTRPLLVDVDPQLIRLQSFPWWLVAVINNRKAVEKHLSPV
jgi:hypothetical protein